jgi:hypothetical protein
MKLMIEYKHRLNSSASDNAAEIASLLATFAKWAPSSAFTIESFVERVDSTGGYIMLETDDLEAVLEFSAQFMPWNDTTVVPVVPVERAVPGRESGWATGPAGARSMGYRRGRSLSAAVIAVSLLSRRRRQAYPPISRPVGSR